MCIKLDYGRVGHTQFMDMFEKMCKARDEKINTKDREVGGSRYNEFIEIMKKQGEYLKRP